MTHDRCHGLYFLSIHFFYLSIVLLSAQSRDSVSPVCQTFLNWLRLLQSLSQNVCLLCVPPGKISFLVNWRLLVKYPIDNNQKTSVFQDRLLQFFCGQNVFWVYGSLQTSLLCIVGELAWGGSVAVDINDQQEVTGER